MNAKLKKGTLALLLMAALALMTTPYVTASPGELWTTDSEGDPKAEFDVFDDVYVMGSGLPADTEITICVMDPHLGIAVAGCTVTTDDDGSIPATLVWSAPLHKITYIKTTIYRLRDHEYEIWADLNGNGQRDDGDASNLLTATYTTTYEPNPEFVSPEPGTMILMLAMFGALATAYLTRKRTHY